MNEDLIGICQNPHSDRFWFPAESASERCADPECDCQPRFYVPRTLPAGDDVEGDEAA